MNIISLFLPSTVLLLGKIILSYCYPVIHDIGCHVALGETKGKTWVKNVNDLVRHSESFSPVVSFVYL